MDVMRGLVIAALGLACSERGLPTERSDLAGRGDPVRDLSVLGGEAGRIACGDKFCDLAGRGEICCQDFNNATTCTTADACHTGVIACDGDEDCPGAHCCGVWGEWYHLSCTAPCMGQPACRSASDCPMHAPFCCRTYLALYCSEHQQGSECR